MLPQGLHGSQPVLLVRVFDGQHLEEFEQRDAIRLFQSTGTITTSLVDTMNHLNFRGWWRKHHDPRLRTEAGRILHAQPVGGRSAW